MRISDWSSDVCSSDLIDRHRAFDVERIRLQRRQHENDAKRDDDCAADDEQNGLQHGNLPMKPPDRKSVVLGTSVYVRVDLGGRRILKNKTQSPFTSSRKYIHEALTKILTI